MSERIRMNDGGPTIEFTPEKLKQLRQEYYQAVVDGKETFMFDGKYEMLVTYAKYLIEYLEHQFQDRL